MEAQTLSPRETAIHISALSRATGKEILAAKRTLAPLPNENPTVTANPVRRWTIAVLNDYNPKALFSREQADETCKKAGEGLGATFEEIALIVRQNLAALGLEITESPVNKETPWETSPNDIIYVTSRKVKQVETAEDEIPEELKALHEKARGIETASLDVKALLDSLIGQYYGVESSTLDSRFKNYSSGVGLPMLMANTNLNPLGTRGLKIYRRNGILILGSAKKEDPIALPVPPKKQPQQVELPKNLRQKLEKFLPSLKGDSQTMYDLLSHLMSNPAGVPIKTLLQQVNSPAIYQIAQNLSRFHLRRLGAKIRIANNIAILIPCQQNS